MQEITIRNLKSDENKAIKIIDAESIQFSDNTMIVIKNVEDLFVLNDIEDYFYAYKDCLYLVYNERGIVYVLENYEIKLNEWLVINNKPIECNSESKPTDADIVKE